jgi:hypothetical protein
VEQAKTRSRETALRREGQPFGRGAFVRQRRQVE